MDVRLRPVRKDDLPMLRRFLTEPDLIGNDWFGFRHTGKVDQRFAEDGFLGTDNGRLMVETRDTEERETRGTEERETRGTEEH